MKPTQISQGGKYHDNKLGVREVISLDGNEVTYRILAIKQSERFDAQQNESVSVIGNTSRCNLASFASWAKVQLTDTTCEQLLLVLEAKKLRLSPGEVAYMKSLGSEYSSRAIKVSFNNSRQVKSLAKKGVLNYSLPNAKGDGEIVLTDLGVAWKNAVEIRTED
jgi:hypothetical protein